MRMRLRVMGHLIIFVPTALRMSGTRQGQAVCRWAMRAATQFLERPRTLGVKVTHSFNLLQLQHHKWDSSEYLQEDCGNYFNWRKKYMTNCRIFINYLQDHEDPIFIFSLNNAKCEMQNAKCDSKHQLRSQSRRQLWRWGGSYRWETKYLDLDRIGDHIITLFRGHSWSYVSSHDCYRALSIIITTTSCRRLPAWYWVRCWWELEDTRAFLRFCPISVFSPFISRKSKIFTPLKYLKYSKLFIFQAVLGWNRPRKLIWRRELK